MSSIFSNLNYRHIVIERAQFWKNNHKGWTLQRLAEKAQIQPPYLTNVLKEKAHLNSDQLYSVCKNLGLNTQETRYILLLLEWERSANQERKASLMEEIQSLRKKNLKTDNHLEATKVDHSIEDLTKFYISPELQLVYAFLGVKRYAANFNLIASRLGISLGQVDKAVMELKDLGLVQPTANGYEKSKKRIHLPKDSPLCSPQQMLMHYRALQHQQLLPSEQKYNFVVTFTSDDETRELIQREFMSFLKKIEKWVKDAPSEEVYQMHFDLFSWSGKQ